MNFQRAFAVCSGLAVPPALYALYSYPPTQSRFYPPCLLHSMTGLHCPGCGATRAAHSLLHGQFAQALAYNALFVLLLPLILYTVWRLWYSCLTNRPLPPDQTPMWLTYILCGVVLLFGLLRNLPFEPFVSLAPHEL